VAAADNNTLPGVAPDEALGRGMREPVPNPKYFGPDFQFLQQTFPEMTPATKENFLQVALNEFKISR